MTHEWGNFLPLTVTPDLEPMSKMASPPVRENFDALALVCSSIACSREIDGCCATTAHFGSLPNLKVPLPDSRCTLLNSTFPSPSSFCSCSSTGGRFCSSDSNSQFTNSHICSSVSSSTLLRTSIRMRPSWFCPLPRELPQKASSSTSQTSSRSPVSLSRLRKSSDRRNLSRWILSMAFNRHDDQSSTSVS